VTGLAPNDIIIKILEKRGLLTMKKSDYKCINKCNPAEHIMLKDSEIVDEISFDYLELAKSADFICCPFCGALYPATIKKIEDYFKIIQIQKKLQPAIELLYLSQYESAIRKSIIILENEIKKNANLKNLNGTDLVGEAFKYQIDKNGTLVSEPKIKINALSDINEINEHEGLKLMLLGFFKGTRNLYMHNNLLTRIYLVLNTFTQVSYFLRSINGGVLSAEISN
jgi:Protein of unknown function (Hypoth_ymh).